jgi:hypothetical protein
MWPLFIAAILAAGLHAAAQSSAGGSGPPPANLPIQGPRPPMEGAGAISGVISDGATHRPLPGAVVYLGIQGHGPVGRMSRQITDAKGRFVFVDLPESDAFFLNVSKAGYNDGHYGDSGPVGSGVASGLVRLAGGQWFNQANIPMWRPGAIAGTVVDERGEPVVGVRVRVLSRILVAGLPHYAAGAAAISDDRGRYRIPGLTPGQYVVNVPSVQSAVPSALTPLEIEGLTPDAPARNSGSDTARRNNGAIALDDGHLLIVGNYATPPPAAGRPQAYPMAFYPTAASVADAATIELVNGESRDGVDLVLRPVPAVRVSGRLEAPPDAVRGSLLRLVGAGLDDLGEGSEVATTVVEPDGTFTFLNVPAGQYTLDATHSMFEYAYGPSRALSSQEMPGTPGRMPGPGTFLGSIFSAPPRTLASGSHSAGDVSLWARVPVSVGGADIEGLSVPMRRAATMHGRFTFEGAGDPPGFTVVFAEPADGRPSLGLQGSSNKPIPGAEDEFTVGGLLPGEYVFRILGLTPRYAVKSIVSGGLDYSTRPIDVSSGQDFNDIVITYTDRIATITGAVQGDPGSSRLLSVLAFPVTRDQWTKYGLTPSRFKTVPVANAGTYKIDNIPAGAYYLVAIDGTQARRWQDPAFLEAASKVASSVTVGWGDTKTQDLRLVVIK